MIVLIVALAPYVLRLFGPWYASQGTLTLRLLALSTLPNIVVSLAVSRARVQRRMITVVVVLGGLCVVVLGLTVLLVPHLGIVGGGIAWLTAECVIATALFISGHLTGALPRLVRSNRGGVPGTVVRAALAERTWECEHVLRTASDTAVIMVRIQETPAVLKVASTQSGVASLRREAEVLAVLGSDQALGTWRSLLPVPLDSGDLNGGAFRPVGCLGEPCSQRRRAASPRPRFTRSHRYTASAGPSSWWTITCCTDGWTSQPSR